MKTRVGIVMFLVHVNHVGQYTRSWVRRISTHMVAVPETEPSEHASAHLMLALRRGEYRALEFVNITSMILRRGEL